MTATARVLQAFWVPTNWANVIAGEGGRVSAAGGRAFVEKSNSERELEEVGVHEVVPPRPLALNPGVVWKLCIECWWWQGQAGRLQGEVFFQCVRSKGPKGCPVLYR